LVLNFTYVITLLYKTFVAVYTFQEREGDTKLPHYEYVAVIPENRRECRLGYKDTLQLPYTCQFYKPISARRTIRQWRTRNNIKDAAEEAREEEIRKRKKDKTKEVEKKESWWQGRERVKKENENLFPTICISKVAG